MKSSPSRIPVLLLLAAPLLAQAQIFDFTINSDNVSVTITGYSGPVGPVVIPSTINNLNVTIIGNSAFTYQDNPTSITIPGTVTTIQTSAFQHCLAVTNVALPDSIITIDTNAFQNCDKLTNIVIPASVTNINNGLAQCGLQNIFFLGDAPAIPYLTGFLADNATAYYLAPSAAWTNFAGSAEIPVVQWNALIPAGGANFGVQGGMFGFNVTGAKGLPIVVQATDSLTDTNWSTLETVTMTNDSYFFSEPFQTNAPGRFYRVTWP